MASLDNPRPEEFLSKHEFEFVFKEAKDLPTEQILNILRGNEISYLDHRDLKEVLLRRNVNFDEIGSSSSPLTLQNSLLFVILLFTIVFFGWKLYQSLKDREKRREEKKKLKQKKKK